MITLYSTRCPKCVVLEKKLNSKGIKFDIVENIETMLKRGFATAPMLEVNGNIMDFVMANKWINEQEVSKFEH